MHGHIRKRHRPTCAKRADRRKRCNCDGSWQARMPDPAGRRPNTEVSRTFGTERDARDWLAAQRGSQLDGTYVDPRKADRPFREVIAAWRESWLDLSPKTRAGYESIIANHLEPEFGAVKVSAITPEAIQRYVNRLAAEGARPGTIRNVYACLRNALSTGVRLKMVAVNPAHKIKLPRLPREPMLFLDAEQVAALAETVGKRNPAWRVAIYLAAYCGLRSGELWALQRQDVDLLRGVLHVRRSLRDVNGHLSWGDTKTGRARTVSMPRFLRDQLRDHLAQPSLGGNGPDGLVFVSSRGHVMRHDLWYSRVFRPAVKRALAEPLHGLRFHDLRHTAASLAIAAGAHPKLVAERLGHSSITITMDRYGHLMSGLESALGEALDAAYNEAQLPASNVVELRR